jgi:hypothetical protein
MAGGEVDGVTREDWITVCQVLYVADHEQASWSEYQRFRRLFPPEKDPLHAVLAGIEDLTYERLWERKGRG